MNRLLNPVLVAVIAAGVTSGSAPALAVEIIAHRGASADAPENTLSAMKLAWEQNSDAIELDLWLSKDGKVVVFHDADTKRFDGQARVVSSLTFEELRQLDVGGWKAPRFAGERVPSLESILATIPSGRRAFLEIKCGPEILPELSRVLRGAGRVPRELAVISFHFETVRESKRLFPAIPHYYLHSYKKDAAGMYPRVEDLIERCRDAGLDGLDLHFDWPIDRSFVSRIHDAGLQLVVWTVDDADRARRLVEAGVDGITTNRPQWLRERLLAPRP